VQSDPLALPTETTKKAEELSKIFVHKLGCNRESEKEEDVCLRNVTAEAIMEAQLSTSFPTQPGDILHKFMPWTPVITADQLPRSPFQAAEQHKLAPVPIMVGSVANESLQFIWEASPKPMTKFDYDVYIEAIFGPRNAEKVFHLYGPPPKDMQHEKDVRRFLSVLGTDYIFTCPIQKWAGLASKKNEVYVYYYNHIGSYNDYLQGKWIPECKGANVCHGVDLPMLFDSVYLVPEEDHPWPTFAEQILSNQMQTVFANFAKSGNPNSPRPIPDLGNKPVKFPRFSKNHNVLFPFPMNGSGPLVKHRHKYCEVFDKIGYHIN
jgi:carboxylesterase type B